MALITCPECDRKVSDQAVACPQCGYPVAEKPTADGPDQAGVRPLFEEAAASSSGSFLEDDLESKRSARVPLLIAGGLLVALAALATDYGGIKTRLLKLTGIAPPTIGSETAVRELFITGSELFDPHSAKFRNLMYTDSNALDNTVWCGEVNAKNRMGAYTGWHQFSASQTDEGEVDVVIYSEMAKEVADLIHDLHCRGTYPAPAHIPLEKK